MHAVRFRRASPSGVRRNRKGCQDCGGLLILNRLSQRGLLDAGPVFALSGVRCGLVCSTLTQDRPVGVVVYRVSGVIRRNLKWIPPFKDAGRSVQEERRRREQQPGSNYGFPRNENKHGSTSGDEEFLAFCHDYATDARLVENKKRSLSGRHHRGCREHQLTE